MCEYLRYEENMMEFMRKHNPKQFYKLFNTKTKLKDKCNTLYNKSRIR